MIGLFLGSMRVIKRGACIMSAILLVVIVVGLFVDIVVTFNALITSSSSSLTLTPYSYPQSEWSTPTAINSFIISPYTVSSC